MPSLCSGQDSCGSQTRAPIALRLCRAESHAKIFAVFGGLPASAMLRNQNPISSVSFRSRRNHRHLAIAPNHGFSGNLRLTVLLGNCVIQAIAETWVPPARGTFAVRRRDIESMINE